MMPMDNADRAAPLRQRSTASNRRRQMIEATLDALAAKGYAAFTIADVARAVGVSTALVLSHFKTKDQLLLEVQRRLAGEYHDNWQRMLEAAGPDPASRLWALALAEFSEATCRPRKILAWKAFWAVPQSRSEYLQEFGPRNVEYLRILTACCAQLIEEGPYPGYEAGLIARMIDSLYGGLWLELTSTATPLTVHEARRAALNHLALLFPRHFTSRGPLRSRAR